MRLGRRRTTLALHRRHLLRGGLDAATATDDGSAIIEFVFVGLVIMVPLVYLLVAVSLVQANQLAVAQAAREAGRAFATAESTDDAAPRVEAAVRLAMAAQHLPVDAQVRFVAVGSGCGGAPVVPVLVPGAEFTVCVSRHVDVPAVPSILEGRGITTIGRYVVHVDEFPDGSRWLSRVGSSMTAARRSR